MTRLPDLLTPLTSTAAAVAALLLILMKPADAQEADPPGAETWRFTAGVGALSIPKYPGSSAQRTVAIPLLSANYGRYFIGGAPGAGAPAGLGAYLIQDTHWKLGVGLGTEIEKPRKESDSASLKGLGDVSRTALGSVFGSYDDDLYSLRSSVTTDIAGKHEGTTASLELEGRYPVNETLMLSAGPSVTWADANYMRTYFGINATQSAASGRAVYATSSGIEAIRFNVGANLRLTPSWGVGARVSFGSLRGDAADSPITEKKEQNTYGLFANYRF